MNGYLVNAITLFKVLYVIKPLVSRCFEGRSITKAEINLLYYIELAFNTMVNEARDVVKMEKETIKKNNPAANLPSFNETKIELMFLFHYLNRKCFIEDNDTNAIGSNSWLLNIWMVYQAKKNIPNQLKEKLGNSYQSLNSIHDYLMGLYLVRRNYIFENIDSHSHNESIRHGATLTFIQPLLENVQDCRQTLNPSAELTKLYATIIKNYPQLYDYIKKKLSVSTPQK